MQSKLVKSWGPYGKGTVVADNAAEAKASPSAIHVGPERFAKLHEEGFLETEAPERPIPSEVKTTAAGEEEALSRPAEDDEDEVRSWGSDEATEYSRAEDAAALEPPAMDKGGHNEPPLATRPNSVPSGQGGKAVRKS